MINSILTTFSMETDGYCTTNQDSNSSVSGGAALAVGPGGLDRHAAGELCLVAARCASPAVFSEAVL